MKPLRKTGEKIRETKERQMVLIVQNTDDREVNDDRADEDDRDDERSE
jgi:hypothetical protein